MHPSGHLQVRSGGGVAITVGHMQEDRGDGT